MTHDGYGPTVDPQSLSDLEAIKQLRARYCRFVDTHDWAAWSALLTEDYRLETELGALEGREAIVSFVSAALDATSSVHQAFAPDLVITGRGTATGIWGYEDRTVFPAEPEPVVLRGYGYLEEEYVRTDAGWRVRSTVETRLQAEDR
jgi:hypothetical protein